MIDNIYKKDYLKRLDNIIQWSDKDVFTRESVSQHSYKVTVFCRIVLQEIFGRLETQSEEVRVFAMRCMDHAIFHDWDEALLMRDMSHEIKYNAYNGDQLREILNEYSRFISSWELTDFTLCDKFVYETMNETDPDVLLLCKFCDWLALAFFLRRERSMGNRNLEAQKETVEKGLQDIGERCRKMLEERFDNKVNIFEQFYKID